MVRGNRESSSLCCCIVAAPPSLSLFGRRKQKSKQAAEEELLQVTYLKIAAMKHIRSSFVLLWFLLVLVGDYNNENMSENQGPRQRLTKRGRLEWIKQLSVAVRHCSCTNNTAVQASRNYMRSGCAITLLLLLRCDQVEMASQRAAALNDHNDDTYCREQIE